MNDVLGDFIPDFRYLVVPLSKYTNQELVDKGDELSLIMLIDKLRNAADFTDRVERRDFTMLFENFETYDVQETRRISKAEGKAEFILELLEDIGTVPEDVKARILKERDLDTLGQWCRAAARAESVEQFAAECLGSEEK